MKVTLLVLLWAPLVPAPVPRCSPMIIINKLAEYNSLMSDSNPYFPVPPCEYGGPLQAIRAGDWKAVSVFAEPAKIPRHNFYELIWLLKTGAARLGRIISGEEKIIVDRNILREGYQHSTPYIRTTQLGHGTPRRPEIIDNKNIFNNVVGGKIASLKREGPDRHPVNYTPTGPLYGKRRRVQSSHPFLRPHGDYIFQDKSVKTRTGKSMKFWPKQAGSNNPWRPVRPVS